MHTSITMHTLHCYFKPTAVVVVKWQDKRLPDPNGPLSSILPAETIGDANNAHSQSTQVQDESKLQPQGPYMKLTSVQQAQIAKYALANGSYHYSKSVFAIGRFPCT